MQSLWRKFRPVLRRIRFPKFRVTQYVRRALERWEQESGSEPGSDTEPEIEPDMDTSEAETAILLEKPRERKKVRIVRPSTSNEYEPNYQKQKDYRKGRRAQKKRNKKRATARRKAARRKARRNHGLANMKIKL